MNSLKQLLKLIFVVFLCVGAAPITATASGVEQRFPINEDWIFRMRGDLTARFTSDGIAVSTRNLSLTVLETYQYGPLTANYITIDLVNRNPGQKGWNVLATTREIKFGPTVKQMDRGNAHRFSFDELIPFNFADNFRHADHWLVVTVHITNNGSSGTVHAHTSRLERSNSSTFIPNNATAVSQKKYEKVVYQSGAFERSARGSQYIWLEEQTDSSRKFQFIETARNQFWITLYDPIRKFTIRLPQKEGSIRLSTNDGRTWRDLYSVRMILPTKVTYTGGSFSRFSLDPFPVWFEVGADYKPKFMFLEKSRNSESVLLIDPTRNFTVRLPIGGGTSTLSTDGGSSWRDLYSHPPVTSALPQSVPKKPKEESPQEVVFAPLTNSVVSHSGTATLSTDGPFLVLKFSDYLIRTDDRNHGKTEKIVNIRFRLVSKSKRSDGSRVIRESEPIELNFTLRDRISRSVFIPDIKVPIDRVPFDSLGDFRLIADLRIDDGRVGVPSEAHPRIDPSRLL